MNLEQINTSKNIRFYNSLVNNKSYLFLKHISIKFYSLDSIITTLLNLHIKHVHLLNINTI